MVVFPCGNNRIAQYFVDKFNVDQTTAKVEAYLFEKSQIFVDLVFAERFFFDTDTSEILVLAEFGSKSFEGFNLKPPSFSSFRQLMRQKLRGKSRCRTNQRSDQATQEEWVNPVHRSAITA